MMEKNYKKERYEITKEESVMKKIETLYRQMVSAGQQENDCKEKDCREKLAVEILSLQKADGSFSVIDDYRCDSDIRVAYVYYPTYYCTAALICAANADGMSETLQSALAKGLKFAAGRRLAGHGYDCTASQIEALNIYKKAGLYKWMKANADVCHEFGNVIHHIVDTYRTRLHSGQTISDWNVDFAEAFRQEVSDYEVGMCAKVWYAAYGSNINQERFMRYIKRCTDPTPPEKSMSITLPYDIYFASKSRTWHGKAVAFLDDTKSGKSLGRMYLITREQFDSVKSNEGPKYQKEIFLGMEEGIPVYTITSTEKRTDPGTPAMDYLETILTGLKETYPDRTELVLSAYLFGCGLLDETDRQVLTFLRESPHGVSLDAIASENGGITKARNSVRKLMSFNMIKQDGRSHAAGHALTSREAIFYTRRQNRELIDILLLKIR